jgi:mercuric ion transport protein
MAMETHQRAAPEKLLAATALVAGIAASSCCVLPLLFVSIGISGAWIGTLTSLAPYQPIFMMAAAASIAAGFWSVYRRSRAVCTGPDCGTVVSRRITKATLWAGLAIVIVAGSAQWWARLLA